MTAMPQMVALFNGVGGGAAALIAAAEFHRLAPLPGNLDGEVVVGIMFSALIGSISFSGSLVAYAKLQELLPGAPITFKGQQIVNALLFAATVAAAVGSRDHAGADLARRGSRRRARLRRHARAPDRRRGHAGRDLVPERLHRPGGSLDRLRALEQRADHRRNARRRLGNAPHRPHGPRDEPLARERPLRRVRRRALGRNAATAVATDGQVAREITADDAAVMLAYADQVMIVPGYGLAVAQAQHAARELADLLEGRGVKVKYAIHPVAGRMPGT